MSQSEKSSYYQALKEAGVEFKHHYREYTGDDLKGFWKELTGSEELGLPEPDPEPVAAPEPVSAATLETVPDLPGAHQNVVDEDTPLFTDEAGLVWYQKEIPKPATPRPRGRRVLRYRDTGAVQTVVQNGQFTEAFEVAGDRNIQSEVKITLPSYQVGVYRDPRYPFKIHTYAGVRGFDLFEVEEFYGGSDLVPAEIKRIYVDTVLCFDMRTTIRTIEDEYRKLQLNGDPR